MSQMMIVLCTVGIQALCPTRWTVRGDAIESIIKLYITLNQLWEECLETRLDLDIKGRIIGVHAGTDGYFQYFVWPSSQYEDLKITDNLSKLGQCLHLKGNQWLSCM